MVEIFASQVGHFSGVSGILDLKTPKMPNLRGNYMLYDRRHLNGCNSFHQVGHFGAKVPQDP